MDRRTFLHKSIATSGTLALAPAAVSQSTGKKSGAENKLLNACYFRAHMYTMVPRHIREDMKWMAGAGTNVVSIAVPEQDLYAAVENIQTVCEEAAKAGMAVHAVPSRWGGLVAGAPKVPSMFSVTNPQTWMLRKDGKPAFNGTSGVTSSIHYPETYDFFCGSVDKIVRIHPNIKGGMPQVLSMNAEQLIYYYYPRNIGDPDRNMATLARHLRKYGD